MMSAAELKKKSKQSEGKMEKGKKHLVGLFAAVIIISFFMAANVMAEENSKKPNYAQVKACVCAQ
jgi:hypothetical protein